MIMRSLETASNPVQLSEEYVVDSDSDRDQGTTQTTAVSCTRESESRKSKVSVPRKSVTKQTKPIAPSQTGTKAFQPDNRAQSKENRVYLALSNRESQKLQSSEKKKPRNKASGMQEHNDDSQIARERQGQAMNHHVVEESASLSHESEGEECSDSESSSKSSSSSAPNEEKAIVGSAEGVSKGINVRPTHFPQDRNIQTVCASELPYQPPLDFHMAPSSTPSSTPLSSSVSSIFSAQNLAGKQLWHFTSPSSFPFSLLKDIPAQDIGRGRKIVCHKGVDYTLIEENIVRQPLRNILLPSSKESNYLRTTTSTTRTFHVHQLVGIPNATIPLNTSVGKARPDLRTTSISAPQQPSGLKMRFRPFGDTKGQVGAKGLDGGSSEGGDHDAKSIKDQQFRIPVGFEDLQGRKKRSMGNMTKQNATNEESSIRKRPRRSEIVNIPSPVGETTSTQVQMNADETGTGEMHIKSSRIKMNKPTKTLKKSKKNPSEVSEDKTHGRAERKKRKEGKGKKNAQE